MEIAAQFVQFCIQLLGNIPWIRRCLNQVCYHLPEIFSLYLLKAAQTVLFLAISALQ